MIPPEPRLDLPFLGVLICGFWLAITSCYYYIKARNYKAERDELKTQLQNLNHAIKADTSSPSTIIKPTKLTGKES